MGRGLARSGRLIWRSLAIPVRVASAHVPIGLLLNAALAWAFTWYSGGEKVLRLAVPTSGDPVMMELTLPQVVIALAFLLAFAVMMTWNYVSEVGALEDRIKPRLDLCFDPSDPTCRQRYEPDEKSPLPYQIIRLRITNMSEAETIEKVRVYVVDHSPGDGTFEPREHLEMMGGTTGEGISIDPGVPAYAELLGIVYPERPSLPTVHARYFRMGAASVLRKLLRRGTWDLTIRVTGRHVKWIDQKYRLTISDSRTEPVELAPIGAPYLAFPRFARFRWPFSGAAAS